MTLFNTSFTFYIDPSTAENSPQVSVAGVGLYFMYRPDAVQNISGQINPGVTMYFSDTVNGVPNIANTSLYTNVARCEWNQINTSSDATAETVFKFKTPITVKTGKIYSVMLNYDNNEQFNLWTNRTGYHLVGTDQPSIGPSGSYGGQMFQFNANIQDISQLAQTNFATDWSPISGLDVKFKIYAARFAVEGVPVFAANNAPNTYVSSSSLLYAYNSGNNTITVEHPVPRVENIQFDPVLSTKQAYVGPQKACQSTVFYPGGGVTIKVASSQSNILVAQSTYSNGHAFNWSDIFGSYTGDRYVTIWDTSGFDIRKVVANTSATTLQLDEPTTFINSASFITISGIGTVDSFNTSFLTGQKQGLMFLRDSSANSSVRFVGDAIDYNLTTISAAGNGYSNSDTLYVYGYDYTANKIVGNYPAIIKLYTNPNGSVNTLMFANIGAGFSNTANVYVIVANSTAVVNSTSVNTSGGSGLVLNVNVGSTILTEHTANIFRKCKVIDVGLSDCFVSSNVSASVNSTLVTQLVTSYYTVADSAGPSGYVSYVSPQSLETTLNQTTNLSSLSRTPVIVSYSNEFITQYFGGGNNDQVNALNGYSNNIVLTYTAQFPNDYEMPVNIGFSTPVIDFGRYIINNDYTNEHTNSGNALARFLLDPVAFQGQNNTSTQCEDIRVYLMGYRPQGTDIKVYARIQNSNDPEPLDDEDWSLLQLIDGNTFSSGKPIQMTYAFKTEPVTLPLAGTVSTSNGSATVTGSNTLFTTLASGDFVKIYDPLFANADFVIAMVNSTPGSDTSLVVSSPFSSNTQTGIGGFSLSGVSGLNISKVKYPNQAYTYVQNNSVVQYYNQNRQLFTEYSTVEFKIILLSSTFQVLPSVSAMSVIGLSA